jgi:hypothetical protein
MLWEGIEWRERRWDRRCSVREVDTAMGAGAAEEEMVMDDGRGPERVDTGIDSERRRVDQP